MKIGVTMFLAVAVVGSGVGCSSSSGETTGNGKSPDQIGANDNPNNLIPNASALLADNIGSGDVGQTFGVDDAHVPYPDTYWPFVNEGTDAHWNGSDASPVEKLMSTTNPAHVADAKSWEHANHGSGVPNVASWWGHCPGWTGAAMSNPPIQHAVYAAADGSGGVASCSPGAQGCTRFEIGDINALEAEVWVDGPSSFIGARCDTSAANIKRDANGRIVRNGSGCQGLNAGALVIALGNRMKRQQLAMAIDAQNDFNTDQIWNQPAYRYSVYRYNGVSQPEAANLVAHGTTTGDQTTYSWDANAKGFAFVDIGIQWVSENGPNTEPVSGLASTHETRFVAVLELDAANDDPAANIIGGEYIDDPSVGADRLTVPPFVWISQGAGPDNLDPSVNGNDHNPWIQPSVVKQLIALGTSNGTDPGTGGGGGPADSGAPPDDAAAGGSDAGSPDATPGPGPEAGVDASADAGSPPVGDCSFSADGLYCGNDGVGGDPGTLYQCTGGSISVSQVCANGCQTNWYGPDACN